MYFENESLKQEIYLKGVPLASGLAEGIAHRISAIDLDSLVTFKQHLSDIESEKKG